MDIYFAMPPPPLKCCVGGCNATSDSHRLFSVPKDDQLRNLWMSFLVPTNPLLIGLTKEQLLRKRVCQQHFDRTQFDEEGRRIRFSYPCLFSSKEIAHGIPLSSEEYQVLAEHNYLQEENDPDDVAEPNALIITQKAEYQVPAEHNYHQKEDNPKDVAETLLFQADNCKHVQDLAHSSCSSAFPSGFYGETDKPMALPKSTQNRKASSITKRLSSKKRKFIREAKQISVDSLGKSGIQRLNDAQKLIENPEFLENFDSLTKQAKTLLIMQLKLVRKNKMARRFEMEEKLLALTLMKQSPKGYKLLEKMFALPSKRTLSRLSEKISFEPGINAKVFKYVKEVTKSWDRKKRLCSITFDELALSPHLTFNEAKDNIEGFVELGEERKQRYCDHALVFMIRGICSPWRQTLAYYFCEGTVSATELIKILKDIVAQVVQTGLKPLGLVCDQGSTFRAAFHTIRQDTIRSRDTQGIRDDGTIEIAGQDLNIFYDPPHLLKSIRNNFLTKDMLFDGKTGSWKDIMFVFDIDSQLGHTRALPKLTANHVIPGKIKKMKVSAATQVLSARTAAMLKYTNALNMRQSQQEKRRREENNPKGEEEKKGEEKAPEESTMATTAAIVEFFDNLFDSVNGSPGCSKRGKLRSAVKKTSRHQEFWQEAIQRIENLKFKDTCSKAAIKAGKFRLVRVPCLDGWVTTLKSFLRLTNILFTEYDVEYYYPRYVNQDPLENFFGRIRAINYRNINPNAHTFIYSFKALILSNILSPHSRFCNCEDDVGETLISLDYLFEQEESNKENVSHLTSSIPTSSSQASDKNLGAQVLTEKIKVQCSAYTAGYLCRKISAYVNCKACIKTYITNEMAGIHKYIEYREYKNLKHNNLSYPNETFLILYRVAAEYVHTYLNMNCHSYNVAKNIKNILKIKLPAPWLGCKKHHNDVINKFYNLIIRMQVHNWCKTINRIFNGNLEEKYVMKMHEPQKMALKKYEKIRIKRKRIEKIKNLNI